MPPRMRPLKPWRLLAWLAGLLLGVPLALVTLALLAVLLGANTAPGQRLIERQAGSLSGGLVAIEGLGGRFPDRLAIRRLTLQDRLGSYAVLDGIKLDWRPLRLLGLTARIDRFSVDRILVRRLPSPAPEPRPRPAASSGPSRIPNLAVDLRRLHVGSLTLRREVAGIAARVGLDGHLRVAGIAPLLAGFSPAQLPGSDIGLALTRQDHAGFVSLVSATAPGRLSLHLHAADPEAGLVSALAGTTLLDPLTLALDLDGPRDAEPLLLALRAGPLALDASGIADLLTRHFDLRLRGRAPAMQPRPGIAWNGLSLDAHLLGTPAAPAGTGTLLLDRPEAAGAGAARVRAQFSGAARDGAASGPATLYLLAEGLRLPGPRPDLLASAPLTLQATLHNEQPGHPVDLLLFHALAQLTGRIFTASTGSASDAQASGLRGSLGLTLPQLGPLAALGGVPLDGHAALRVEFSRRDTATVLGVGGTVALTGGQPQAVGLIGDRGVIGLTASVAGQDLRLYSLALSGRALALQASGSVLSRVLDASFGLRIPDLRAALPTLRGALALDGSAQGPLDDVAARLGASGTVGTAAVPEGAVRLALDATHLPRAPQAHLRLDASLDRAPLILDARLQRLVDGAVHLSLDRLGWKSAGGHADLTLPPGASLPLGNLELRMTRLADLSRVAGQAIGGSLAAVLRTTQPGGAAHPMLRLDLTGSASTAAARVGRLALGGTVQDPAGDPDIDLSLRADGIFARGASGAARATMRGRQKALAIALQGGFDHVAGAPARIDTALVLDLPDRRVSIGRLAAQAKGEALRLLAPSRIGFGPRLEVDRLRATLAPLAGGAAPATLDVAGTISPRLDLTASLANLTPALARPFAPGLDAGGVIALQARLTGSTARPDGSVHLTAQGLRLRSGPGASLPAADLDARADLAGTSARIAARLAAGRQIGLTLSGTAPLAADGALGLRAAGHVDLAVGNAVLGAQGRQAAGQLALDLGVGGTVRAPQLDGTIQLSGGQVQDFGQGLRLTDIAALIRAQGQTLSIERFTARAGDGSIGASGSVGALAPGLPVDLHITASRARPLSSDLLTAVLDADLSVRGQAASRLDLAGSLTVDSASINVPSGLPPSVAKLDVRRPGDQPAPPPTAPAAVVGLDLTLRAPGQIFVRGHGLDAELGGTLHVGGTTAAPVIAGGFDMRHGTFSLVGATLTFTKGRVGFDGAGVTNKIDPSLDFTAESFVNADVAQLHVGGYADAPTITLSSTPPLPQDQVLALILFQQSTTQLSPLQIASLAAGLAELSGVGGGGPGVLGAVRGRLGLDRLSVGSGGANSTGASVEAGKYVTRGVYVGARQSTSGSGTQAQVQVDLTKRLKLNTVVGTGGTVTGTTTPENDPGSSVGLTYQFQY